MSGRGDDLDRFVTAQEPVYGQVLAELRQGRKTSHWMWFTFPQIAGLGRSPTSEHFAIRSLDEAQAYLADPLLGARLRECTGLLLEITAASAEEVFGAVDARKLRSCMTLFHRAAPDEPIFRQVLAEWFDGTADPMTDALLEAAGRSRAQ